LLEKSLQTSQQRLFNDPAKAAAIAPLESHPICGAKPAAANFRKGLASDRIRVNPIDKPDTKRKNRPAAAQGARAN
jgi:hypothetical protein